MRTKSVVRVGLAVAAAACLFMAAAGGEENRAAIVVYEAHGRAGAYRDDIDLLAQRMTIDGQLTWSDGRRSATVSNNDTYLEQHFVAVPDGEGGTIVVFEAKARKGRFRGDIDLFAARLDANGARQWLTEISTSEKLQEQRPAAVSDGQGGVIVVFEAEWREGEYAGDIDLFAQRLDASGAPVWNEGKPKAVSTSKHFERSPALLADGAGGAFVACEVELRTGEYQGDYDIYAQRLNADGTLAWGDGEKPLPALNSAWRETKPQLVSDGQGGVYVVSLAQAPPNDPGRVPDIDVMAQRLSGAGEPLWNEGKQAVDVAASAALENDFSAVADGAGNLLVAYVAAPAESGESADGDILAQKLSSDGNRCWVVDSRPAMAGCSTWNEREPRAIADGQGGLIVVFSAEAPEGGENAGDVDIMAQRITADGAAAWNQGERALGVMTSRHLERNPRLASDGAGGGLVVCEAVKQEGEHAGDYEIIGQRLDASGALCWNSGEKPLLIASSEWSEKNPQIVPGWQE